MIVEGRIVNLGVLLNYSSVLFLGADIMVCFIIIIIIIIIIIRDIEWDLVGNRDACLHSPDPYAFISTNTVKEVYAHVLTC